MGSEERSDSTGLDERRWRVRAALEDGADALSSHELALWTFAVGMLVFDLGLTAYGLRNGLHEQNLLAVRLLDQFGVGGLALLKLSALGAALGLRHLVPERFVFIVPLALGLPWLLAAVLNTVTIVQSLG